MSEPESIMPKPIESKPKSLLSSSLGWIKRIALILAGLITTYLLIVLIGLIPANSDFEPAGPEGIEIAIESNSVHADLVLPIETRIINWRDHFPADTFTGETDWCTHVSIGWGDEGFYVDTPTWADFKTTTAANALLLPSSTVMHVSLGNLKFRDPATYRTVRISEDQYRAMVDYILTSFKTDLTETDLTKTNAKSASKVLPPKILIAGKSYGMMDAFFQANGGYHCFNTCNCWVGGAMKTAGIKVPFFSPLPKSVYLYLPEKTGQSSGNP